MSRITGFFATGGSAEVDQTDLRHAVAALQRLGTGSATIFAGGSEVGLGLARLRQEPQPAISRGLRSIDGTQALAMDGELYNGAELRRELEGKGHAFSDRVDDAEAVLAAFRQWGAQEGAKRLEGIFAIAAWDARTGTLTLARDRMGVKPLYYGWNGRTLWFGSELKALRAYRHWVPRIDPSALADFFRFIYIAEPRSIYQQVSKLAPGQVLQLARGGEPRLERYWSVLAAFQPTEPQGSEEDLCDQLESLVSQASRRRAVSDAPIGLLLSGGIDSSLVAALVPRDGARIQTLTIGFDDPRFSEASEAERVARHLGHDHATHFVSDAEAIEVLPTWGDVFDEPFGDCSGIPTLLAAKLAARYAELVLLADGADEMFGSYHSFPSVFQRMSAQRGAVKGKVAGALAAALPWDRIDGGLAARPGMADWNRSFVRKVSRHLRYLREVGGLSTPGAWYEHSMTSPNWIEQDVNRLLGGPASKRANCDAYPGSPEEQMRLWDLVHYTAGDILTKVDRCTMAAGIQFREPLLDSRVVALALSLSERMRFGPYGSKHLLRKVLYRHVPRALIDRPKMGFAPPIGRWMTGALKPLLDHHLDARRIAQQGILDPKMVSTVRRRFEAGDADSVQRVFLLLAFQLWHARWMEGPALARAPFRVAADDASMIEVAA